MALTFRAFFQGLSQSAPAIANLIYMKHTEDYQRGVQERQLQMEGKKTQAYTEMVGAQTKLTEASADEMRQLLPLRKKEQEYKTQWQQYLMDDEKDKRASMDMYPGGAPALYAEKNRLTMEGLKSNIDRDLAAIVASKASSASSFAQSELSKLQGSLMQIKFGTDVVTTAHALAKTPEAQAWVDQLVKDNTNDNGELDWRSVSAQIAEQGSKFWSSEEKASILNVSEQYYKTAIEMKSAKAKYEANLRMALANPTTGKELAKQMGIDNLKDAEQVSSAIAASSNLIFPQDDFQAINQYVDWYKKMMQGGAVPMTGKEEERSPTTPAKPSGAKYNMFDTLESINPVGSITDFMLYGGVIPFASSQLGAAKTIGKKTGLYK